MTEESQLLLSELIQTAKDIIDSEEADLQYYWDFVLYIAGLDGDPDYS